MRTYIRHRRKTGLIAALAVLAVIAVTVVSLRITEVKVSGNTRYTAEEIEQTIFDSPISETPLTVISSISSGLIRSFRLWKTTG